MSTAMSHALPIRTFLEISMQHVPQRTEDALDSAHVEAPEFWSAVSWAPFGAGAFVYVSNEQSAGARRCGHPELGDAIDFAARAGCDWLRLEPEGAVMPDLAVYPR
jgi:hypothetical protein